MINLSADFLQNPEYLKLILDNSSEGIITCDENFSIKYSNKRAYELHGVPFNHNPDNWPDFVTVFNADGTTPTPLEELPLPRALKGETVKDSYHFLRRKIGGDILVKYNSKPLYDSNGAQIGAIVTTQDSQALAFSQARFKAIFEQSPLSIQILNREGKTLLVNKSFQKLWDISDDFLNNFILKEYNILEDPLLIKAGHIEQIRKAFRGEPTITENVFYDPSSIGLPGRARWASAVIYPLKNLMGEVNEVVIIHKDDTSQKEVENEKEKLYSQIETIIRQMPAGILVADSSGSVQLINEQMNKIIGDERRSHDVLKKHLERALKDETNVEELQLAGEGTLKTLSTVFAPIRDNNENVKTGVVMVRDISEQKRVESHRAFLAQVKTLLISTLNSDEVLDKISIAAIPYFCDSCFIDIMEGEEIKRIVCKHRDPVLQALLFEMGAKYPTRKGTILPNAQVIESGKPLFYPEVTEEILIRGTPDQDLCKMVLRFGSKSHITVPISIRGKTFGAISFINTTSRPYFNEQDLEVATTLGHYAALAIENARLYKDAQMAIQLRDDFISMASHELRTPLASLTLQVDVLNDLISGLEEKEVTKLIHKFLNGTNHQVQRIGRLVNDMLDISRISHGKLTLKMKEVNYKELLSSVIERFQDQLKNEKIEHAFFCDNDVFGTCDPERIDQAITNFITNAIRYGRKRPIHIHLSENENAVVLKVQDFGKGIHADDFQRIFNRFERVESAEDVNGLGLGLYINKKIIEEHYGHITLESELGKGTTFIIEIPKLQP